MILAIDPGIANTGWACSDGRSGCITTESHIALNKRICDISKRLYKIGQPTPKTVIIEDTFGQLLKATTMLLGGLFLVFPKSEVVLVPPSKWIKDLFGNYKRDTHKQLTRQLVDKLGIKYETQHACDALGLIEWYKLYGTPKDRTPPRTKAKRKVLRNSQSKTKRSKLRGV